MKGWAERMLRSLFPDAPERGRLEGAIQETVVALAQAKVENRENEWWYRCADQQLERARQFLAEGNLHQGWVSVHSAKALLLLNPHRTEKLHPEAIELQYDMERLSGRRAKAIAALICDDKGELRADLSEQPMRVVQAIAIRDDQFQTNYFKILLRRRHLRWLFLLLVVGIVAVLLLSGLGLLPHPFDNARLMAGVVVFGILGAALSIARGLLKTNLSKKIPAQQIGAFVIWMRPAIGAAAALISFVLLNAKAIRLFEWDVNEPTVIFTVAAISGFSERFIVGAIEKISGDEDEDKGTKKPDKDKDKTKLDKNKDKDKTKPEKYKDREKDLE